MHRRMKQCLLLVILGILISRSSLLGQSVLRIVDSGTKLALAGVRVECINSGKVFLSDEQGNVPLTKNETGCTPLRITHVGYEPVVVQRDSVAALQTVYLTPSAFVLDDLVVAATRWQHSKESLPIRVATIAKKDVQLYQPQTSADMLGIQGHVFVQKSQQGGGSPMVRGFAANRLLIVVDGVRMNNAIFRGGNLHNVLNIDPFTLQQTEVLFGSNSVMYGSDAIGGVLHFQTLAPHFSNDSLPVVKAEAVLQTATANREQTGHLRLSLGRKKWAWVGSVSHWDFGDLRQGRFGPDDYLKPFEVKRIAGRDSVLTLANPLIQTPSGYQQLNTSHKLGFRPSETLALTYALYYSQTSSFGRYDRHNRLRNGLPRYAEWDYGPQTWLMNVLTLDLSRTTRLYDQATLRVAHQQFGESRIERNLHDPIRFTQKESVQALSLSYDLRKEFSTQTVAYYGLEGLDNRVHSTGSRTPIETGTRSAAQARYPQADWRVGAAYLTVEHTVGPRLNLQAGMRYSLFDLKAQYDTTFLPLPVVSSVNRYSAFSASAGGVYTSESGWKVAVQLSRAFRAPNVDDIGKVFDSEPNAVTVPNPSLRPEYAYSADIRIEKKFGTRITGVVNAYHTRLEGAMVRRNFTLNGLDQVLYQGVLSRVQAIQNAAQTRVTGVEWEARLRLVSGWTFIGQATLQKGTEEMDDGSSGPSRHAIPSFGSLRLSYERSRLQAVLYFLYQGEIRSERLAIEERAKREIYAQDAQALSYAPAWQTLNLKFSYAVTSWASLQAGMENVLDRRYRPYSSGISAAGRNVTLSLRTTL